MPTIFRTLVKRLKTSLTTMPAPREWGVAGVLLAGMAVVVLPAGLGTGFFTLAPGAVRWQTALLAAAGALAAPALVEELIFRALLLPSAGEATSPRKWWEWGAAGLALFVVYHPLKSLISPPAAARVFTNPVFLLFAAVLGACCTYSYYRSKSLWPPVLIHWLSVAVWLVFLGGINRMTR